MSLKISDHGASDKKFIAQKVKFSVKHFFSKCDRIRSFIFIEEILNRKLYFWYSGCISSDSETGNFSDDYMINFFSLISETALQRCSLEKVFRKYSAN